MIAEIIINSIARQLNKTYDYIIPQEMTYQAQIGSRVFVPFGKIKQEEGFIINIKEKSSFANKEILKIEDNILTNENIELAKLMSKRYFCNVSDCIKLMLPPGNTTKNIVNRIKEKKANFVYLNKKEEIRLLIKQKVIKLEKQKRILEFLLKNEGISISDLNSFTDTTKSTIKTLEKNQYIKLLEEKIDRNPFIHKNIKKDKPLKLTEEQKEAYNKIKDSKYKEFLIYGVTGSRKNGSIFAINTKCIKT